MSPPSPFVATSSVALGGAIGAVLRHQMGRGMTHWLGVQAVTTFPWATLAVNVVGSLAMGLLAGFLARHGQGGEHWRLFLGVGLLGGFTTYSTFSVQAVLEADGGRPGVALGYVAASVIGGIAAAAAGYALGRALA